MHKSEFLINDIKELDEVAKYIISLFPSQNLFLLDGEMGVGKTTLIKKICNQLGINDACSPSFSIINNYITKKNKEIFHVDCYRIEDENEVENIGLLEILDNELTCFVEWPKKIHNFLPKKSVNIKIESQNNLRKISIVI
tara:strand:+ start:573 stop:992 length:420 start_codon:yes stop_codon:yes gene_type:complete